MNLRRSPIYEKLLYYRWGVIAALLLLLCIASLVGLYFVTGSGRGPAVSQMTPTREVTVATPTVEARPTLAPTPEPPSPPESISTPTPEPMPISEPTPTPIPEPTATSEPARVSVATEAPAAGQNPPKLSGTGPAGAKIRIFDGETLLGEVTAGADGTWAFTPANPLVVGEHTLTANAIDKAGAKISTSEPLTFTVSEPAPVPVVIKAPAAGQNPPRLSGTGPAGVKIRISDGDTLLGEVTAGVDGIWAFTPTDSLRVGEHTLTAIAVDRTGTKISASEPLVLTIGPAILPVTGGE
jgi:hypothetical protein